MRGRFFAGLALAGVVTLSGCSSNSSTGSKNSATPQAVQSGASEAAPANLTWFSGIGFWTPPSTWSTDPNTVQGAITKKTGLTFNFNIPAQDGDTKLSLMMVSNQNLPDVMSISNDILAKKLIEADKVWKLDEFLKKYDPNSHLLKDFPNDIMKGITARDGGWYAYPSHMNSPDSRIQYPPSSEFFADGDKYREGNGIIFNQTLLKQAGIALSDLKTEDDVLAAYKKVKDMKLTVNGAPVIPLQFDGKTYQDSSLSYLQWTFGAMPIDKEGKYRDILLAPETKHAIEFMFKAAQGGFFNPSQLTLDSTGTKAAIMSGRVFSYIGNTSDTGFSDQDFWVSTGPIISNQGTKPVLGRSTDRGNGWMQTFFSKTTKEPERLAKWLSFMSSNEGMLLAYYGFEGTHYTLNDKGLVVQTKQGMQDYKDFSKTGVGAFWPFHHIAWHDHVTEAPAVMTGPDGVEAMQVQNAYGKATETVKYDNRATVLPGGFYAPGSKAITIRDQIKLYREAQISRMVLAKDAATMNKLYEEYIVKLKELGITELDTMINEQVQKKSKELGLSLKGVNS
jgi:putative aldouronate transport system substrate-binding protein